MKHAALTCVVALLFSPAAFARHFVWTQLDDGLEQAAAITQAGDDRLFVVSKEGLVWIYRQGVRHPTPFLDIRDRVLFTGEPASEQGLLSVVFHPQFATNGFLFAAYTEADGTAVVSRFSVSGPIPDQASRGSERILLRVPQPGPNHNLNHLAFGPDGKLYIGSGDGGYQPEPRCTPQEGDNLLGKILRLDVDSQVDTPPYHAIPADNPFVSDPAIRDEIWALGTRNPWRFSFDAAGNFWLADVGQTLREEVDFLPAGTRGGQNWGFKMMEGFACRGNAANCEDPVPPCFDAAYTAPVLDYGHDGRHCAIIGGHVYRGNAIPALRGAFLAGDYCGAGFLVHRENGAFRFENLSTDLFGLVSFGEDAAGETYALADGKLLRLVDLAEDNTLAFTSSVFTATENTNTAVVTVQRTGSSQGTVSVAYATQPGSALATDFVATQGILTWPDGDTTTRSFQVPLLDDSELEGSERFRVTLTEPVGAVLGDLASAEVEIRDDEITAGPCVPSDATLCLGGDRFRVSLTWRDYLGQEGVGHAVPLDASASGFFWFFERDNIEMLVKNLDACALSGNYWFFAAATTNVGYTLRIVDTQTGRLREYRNILGQTATPIIDTTAFPCP